jgi:transcriptional regulator with XRE-family HTH domain
MANIGRHVRELRRRRQLSARELAARAGVSHSTISLIERDRMSPSVDTLGAVVEALGTTMVEFFSGLRASHDHSPVYRPEDLDTGAIFSHDAQEAGLVLEGRIELTVGEETWILTEGHGYYFDSNRPHRFRNVGDGPARIVSAITPPSY